MLFDRFFKINPYLDLTEKIKYDLVSSFQKKGLNIREIEVDLNFKYMNVKVLIPDK